MSAKDVKPPVVAVRRVELQYFGIVLVPIAIFVINVGVTRHLIAADLEVPTDILREGAHWLEAAGRYRFLAATWFFAALTVLAVALLVRNLARPMARETRLAAIATWLLVLLLALVPSIEDAMNPGGPRVYHRLGSAVFEAALSRGTLPGCAGPEDLWLLGRCGDVPVITMFNRVVDIINALAGLGVGALIVGMILCLDHRACTDIEEEAAQLADNLRRMRQQLYLSSLILTFGMFFAASWMYWPLQLVQESERASYGAVVSSTALFTGTYFSLLIMSFYLPVAIILEGRARRLADRAGQDAPGDEAPDAEGWKAAHGLKEGAADYLRAGFALTAPILTAFAGGISPLAL